MLTLVPLLSTQLMAESLDKPESIDHLLCQYAQDNGFKVILDNHTGGSSEFEIKECKSHYSDGRKAAIVVLKTDKWARFTCQVKGGSHRIANKHPYSYFMLENGTKAYFSFKTPQSDHIASQIRSSNFWKLKVNFGTGTCDMSTADGYFDTIELSVTFKSFSYE